MKYILGSNVKPFCAFSESFDKDIDFKSSLT